MQVVFCWFLFSDELLSPVVAVLHISDTDMREVRIHNVFSVAFTEGRQLLDSAVHRKIRTSKKPLACSKWFFSLFVFCPKLVQTLGAAVFFAFFNKLAKSLYDTLVEKGEENSGTQSLYKLWTEYK